MTENIVDKISNYNIFNYFFPGVIYVVSVNHFTRISLPTENLLVTLFLCYFIGLVISRIGALIIPLLIKRPEEALYKDFIEAAKQDSQINVLSSECNVYRTMISLGILILITIAFDAIVNWLNIPEMAIVIFLVIVLIILFILAYIRQTKFIIARIKNTKK